MPISHARSSPTFRSAIARVAVAAIALLAWHVAADAQSQASQRIQLDTLLRIQGHNASALRGQGLVTGLNKTGDPGKDLIVARPLAEYLNNNGNPVELADLGASRSAAVVMVNAEIPAAGARSGDRFDAIVTTVHTASSLSGGFVEISLLAGPVRGDEVYAVVRGPIVLDDPSHPTRGRVVGGVQIIRDILPPPLSDTFALVVRPEYAGPQAAEAIASHINSTWFNVPDWDDGRPLVATPRNDDGRLIDITVPAMERSNIPRFVGEIMTYRIERGALKLAPRITINRHSGTITMSADVWFSAAAFTDPSLSITSTLPPPVATPESPIVETRRVGAIDQAGNAPRDLILLSDLVKTFEALRVPAEARIRVLEQLKAGALLPVDIVYVGGGAP